MELLVVFLPEYGDLRLHDVEQLEHDRGHAAKVARAKAALELVGDWRGLDHECLRLRIHLRIIGMEDDLDALLRKLLAILCESARITLEILTAGELHPVNEDR